MAITNTSTYPTAAAPAAPATTRAGHRRAIPKPNPRLFEPTMASPQSGSAAARAALRPLYTVESRQMADASSASSLSPAARMDDGEADGIVHIIRTDEVAAFAGYLLHGQRRLPAVVATRRSDTGACEFDTTALAGDLRSIASVYELGSADASWRLLDALSNETHVFGGMLRLYPAGVDWFADPSLLRGPYGGHTPAQCARWFSQLVNDAFDMAIRSGALLTPVDHVRNVATKGTILGTISTRGIAQIDGGAMASVVMPAEAGDVPADRVFAKGQRVCGVLDTVSNIMTGLSMRKPDEAVSGYENGMTVLGRIDKVCRDYCRVTLYPGMTITVRAEDALDDMFDQDNDDLRSLACAGTVLPMLIESRGTSEFDWRMSLLGANGDAVRPAPSLLVDGPSWLLPQDIGQLGREETAARRAIEINGDTDLKSLVPKDADGASADMIVTLASQLYEEQKRNAELHDKYDRKCRMYISLQNDAKRQRLFRIHQDSQYRSMRGLFTDDNQRLRCESDRFDAWIREAWALRFSAEEKTRYMLPDSWRYAPGFFDTMNDTVIDKQQVVRACVDVLVGLAERSKSRGLHPLREGSGGDDAVRLGPNGGKMYRVRLEQGHAARRMHYELGERGMITFVSVGVHDDGLRR